MNTLILNKVNKNMIYNNFKISKLQLISISSVIFMFLLWTFVTSFGFADPLFLPGPTAVWDAFIKASFKGYQGHTLLEHVLTSFLNSK